MATNSTAPPILTPETQDSVSVLPPTGSHSDVPGMVSLGVYTDLASPLYSPEFISGAVDQVSYTYNKLAGNILDIELHPQNVYSHYEEAVLEYSYIVNMHQAENSLSSLLGSPSGSFDQDGNLISGSISNTEVNTVYPNFSFGYARNIAESVATEAALNGTWTEYSASVAVVPNQQDYDLQAAVEAMPEFSGSVGDKRIRITKVFFMSPRAIWRFYGYYGGLTTVGNFHNYGQWADDASFEIIPVWQNKLQAMQYENAIYTRLSHFSYEIKNNKLRIYPVPASASIGPNRIWFRFYIPKAGWEDDGDPARYGVNNFNTLPFANIKYTSINSMGKEWIRAYAFALSLESLGYVRSKISTIPIPGNSVTLNGPELLRQGKEDQDKLKDQLKEWLEKMTYSSLMEKEKDMMENAKNMINHVPLPIFVG